MDGIFAVLYNGSDDVFTCLLMPVVFVDRELFDAGLPIIVSDFCPGIDVVVVYFLECGYYYIGYFFGFMIMFIGVGRFAVFEEVCGRHGVDKREIYHGGFDCVEGY